MFSSSPSVTLRVPVKLAPDPGVPMSNGIVVLLEAPDELFVSPVIEDGDAVPPAVPSTMMLTEVTPAGTVKVSADENVTV
jgi:hypothetical protein